MRGADPDLEQLRQRVAAAGVPIFRIDIPSRGAAPVAAEADRSAAEASALAALLRDLIDCPDARLVAAVPSVLVSSECSEAALRIVAESADATALRRLGFLHRIARALVESRAPDLRQRFGFLPRMTPFTHEPPELPDPAADHGETLLREVVDPQTAAGAEWGPLAGDAIDMFDTWTRLRAADGVHA